jgi:hypothetical protein
MYSVELGDVNPQILEGLNSVQHPRCHWLQQSCSTASATHVPRQQHHLQKLHRLHYCRS